MCTRFQGSEIHSCFKHVDRQASNGTVKFVLATLFMKVGPGQTTSWPLSGQVHCIHINIFISYWTLYIYPFEFPGSNRDTLRYRCDTGTWHQLEDTQSLKVYTLTWPRKLFEKHVELYWFDQSRWQVIYTKVRYRQNEHHTHIYYIYRQSHSPKRFFDQLDESMRHKWSKCHILERANLVDAT